MTSAVCGEYARKLLWVRRLRWSQACNLGTINPSRKLRRFESFTCHHVLKGPLTCGNAGQGPSSCTRWGIQMAVHESVIPALGRRPVTCANASTEPGGVEVRAEYVRKFGFTPPHWPDSSGADLRGCRGMGYVMAADVQAIAIEALRMSVAGRCRRAS